ncbi:bifunctional indole-3-glycerol-phosphate synthase TrpC/phosphoribosylanthranilate isomerase TrpF [Thalassotalea sp. PS06]|uniref:bifunctional indole-3-glycerol-phosphate synthase TrpC/phosphoribosylanthranilate isomerase TrpF n=1 Tax=Thalassotalea sp. PS06 TaxID=2594005 RepID=UPI0011621280|nr:bifunctional indole-3-glycerol-phosphate synthase TrpC/phosphoribosylanthranilate isomerase TrpF [Thalassotalea sp. PS06]QDP00876.1 bifunctional indole-3-glycerol-phosphate synthase TrpC/phosphoribosylanthranilate isomerase TrpF [Thalassotalea sp. PS06]
MANILQKIVEDKRIEIAQRKQEFPLASFIYTLTPSQKNFYGALSEENAGFILECKKASPSKGLIRDDFNVEEIADIYQNYAAVISVLTDEKYFQGTFEYLQQVTQRVSCPVLNKDFFVDEYQIYLARYYGADGVLLMLSVLDDEEYLTLSELAHSLNLGVLTEVSNVEETERAIRLNARLIGINNRNLRDLSTDITRTFELAPMIPEDRLIISESGIYHNHQVREIAPAVDGFLVGSSIMAQADIDLACRTLIYGNHKVCGLTQVEDAITAASEGAVYGGVIFVEKSPRYVEPKQAKAIIDAVTAKGLALNFVGVFADDDIEQVQRLANVLKLSAVQLHGSEDQAYINTLKPGLPSGCQIIKAVKVIDAAPELNSDELGNDLYLLDNYKGGSGKAFDWQLIEDSDALFNNSFLAGGLAPDNLDKALTLLVNQEFYGLDMNSGVEGSAGVKSPEKVALAFRKIRRY